MSKHKDLPITKLQTKDKKYLHDELVGLANGGGHTSDGAPRVHNSLASGDGGVGLQGAVLELKISLRFCYVML